MKLLELKKQNKDLIDDKLNQMQTQIDIMKC